MPPAVGSIPIWSTFHLFGPWVCTGKTLLSHGRDARIVTERAHFVRCVTQGG